MPEEKVKLRMINNEINNTNGYDYERMKLQNYFDALRKGNLNDEKILKMISTILDDMKNIKDDFFDQYTELFIDIGIHSFVFDLIFENNDKILCECLNIILLISSSSCDQKQNIFSNDILRELLKIADIYFNISNHVVEEEHLNKLIFKYSINIIKNLTIDKIIPDIGVLDILNNFLFLVGNLNPTTEKNYKTRLVRFIFSLFHAVVDSYHESIKVNEYNGLLVVINKWVFQEYDVNLESQICISCLCSAINCMNCIVDYFPNSFEFFFNKLSIDVYLIQFLKSSFPKMKLNGLNMLYKMFCTEGHNYQINDNFWSNLETYLKYEYDDKIKIAFLYIMSDIIASENCDIYQLFENGIISQILMLSDSQQESFQVREQAILAIANNIDYLTNIEMSYLVNSGVIHVLVQSLEIFEVVPDCLVSILKAIYIILSYIEKIEHVFFVKYLEEFIRSDIYIMLDSIKESLHQSDEINQQLDQVYNKLNSLVHLCGSSDINKRIEEKKLMHSYFIEDDLNEYEYDS